MIIVLDRSTPPEERRALLAALRELGLEGREIEGTERPLLHVLRGPTPRARKLLAREHVEGLVPTSGPRIRRAGRRFYPYHFIGRSAAALLAVGTLVFLAGILPPGVDADADLRQAADVGSIVLPWYLLPLRGLARLAPGGAITLGWIAAIAITVCLLALPIAARGRAGQRIGWVVAGVLAALLAALGAVGAGA